MAIPDGLHITKLIGITEALRDTDFLSPSTNEIEAFLVITSLVDRLSRADEENYDAQQAEAHVGTDFVSEAEVLEIIGLLEGPSEEYPTRA